MTASPNEMAWLKANGHLKTKTARLLHSFQSITLRDEHRNYGDEGPYLRDFGFAPVVASRLIRWGEESGLVCTFENERGVSDRCHCWKSVFLVEAAEAHMAKFGSDDLTADFVEWVVSARVAITRQAETAEIERPRGG